MTDFGGYMKSLFAGVWAAFAVIGVFAPGFVSATTIYSNTISTSGTPNMLERLVRDGIPSDCGLGKAFPGTISGGNFAYQETTFTNVGPRNCISFVVQATCSGNPSAFPFGAFLAGYSGTFDPTNLATGYLGDTGVSSGTNDPVTMQLNLGSGQSVTLVVMETNDDTTNPPQVCDYTIAANVAGVVPATSGIGLLITALGVGGFGFAYLRRRSVGA
jgi:hypothetical protein